MEIAVGVSCAIRRDEQVCAVEIRRVDRRKLDLHRPLAQLGGHSARAWRGFAVAAVHVELADAAAGTAALVRLLRVLARFDVLSDGGFVVSGGVALFDGNRPGRARGQAVAQPVAVIVADEPSLAVHHRDSAFVAGVGARAAAVAEFLIDMHNFANHKITPKSLIYGIHYSMMNGKRTLE